MNKKIIAGAVFAALSTAAAAQSSVQVYGIVDAGVNYQGSPVVQGAGSKWSLMSGNNSGSRIGFKGQEDLGNGLKAIFTLENGFSVDSGKTTQDTNKTQTLFGRQAFVGLTGNFGTVKLGRQYAPFDVVLAATDAFGNGLDGRASNIAANKAGFTKGGYAVRVDNLVAYETPNFSGFSGGLAYGFGEVQGDNKAGRTIALNGQYKNDALYVGAAFQQTNGTANLSGEKRQDWLLGAAYDFGVVRANAFYGQAKDATVVAGTDLKEQFYGIGVSAPFGAHKVMASVGQVKNKTDNQSGKATQYALGYTYNLSKRTNFYASVARITNSDGATLVVNNGADGIGRTGATVGIRHAF